MRGRDSRGRRHAAAARAGGAARALGARPRAAVRRSPARARRHAKREGAGRSRARSSAAGIAVGERARDRADARGRLHRAAGAARAAERARRRRRQSIERGLLMQTSHDCRVLMVLALAMHARRGRRRRRALSLTLDDAIRRGRRAGAPAGRGAGARSGGRRRRRVARGARARRPCTALGRLPADESRRRVRRSRRPDGTRHVIFPDIPDNYRARAEMDVPIYTAGRVDALVDSARADVARARRPIARRSKRTSGSTSRARTGRSSPRARASRVLEQALAARRTRASATCRRAWTPACCRRTTCCRRRRSARAQNVQLIQARNAAAVAEIDLARLIGAGPDQPIVPTTAVDQPLRRRRRRWRRSRSTRSSRARASSAAERAGLRARQAALCAPARTPRWPTPRPQVGGARGRRAGAAQPALRAAHRRVEDVVGPRAST